MSKLADLKTEVSCEVDDVEFGGGVVGEGLGVHDGLPPGDPGVRAQVPLEHLTQEAGTGLLS